MVARSIAWSAPDGTLRRAAPISTVSVAGAVTAAMRSTRTIRTRHAGFVAAVLVAISRCLNWRAQCHSALGLNPRSFENSRTVRPLSRQPCTRPVHFCSVAVMHTDMRHHITQRKNGVRAADTVR